MNDFDLDAFIRDIEDSAAKEEELEAGRCRECNIGTLEDVDGVWICTNCSAQATEILQLEETEVQYNESGAPIHGGVKEGEARPRHTIDYGRAWSTDEAIAMILCAQLKALKDNEIVPGAFCESVKKMWIKFWLDHVRPVIKDVYEESDLLPAELTKRLHLRDIDVLVRVKDKFYVPKYLRRGGRVKSSYKSAGVTYRKRKSDCHDDCLEDENNRPRARIHLPDDIKPKLEKYDGSSTPPMSASSFSEFEDGHEPLERDTCSISLRKPNLDNITILTLNRTLAFIEGAARCVKLENPIFASDIIRLCNQRVIPYFGAHKLLPEDMKLTSRDLSMFRSSTQLHPDTLSRATGVLLNKIYMDKLPFSLPSPDATQILKRFLRDLNLPYDLIDTVTAKLDFSSLSKTRDFVYKPTTKKVSRLPHYDRWAFAILLAHLKQVFGLDDKSIRAQSKLAKTKGDNYFILRDWIDQLDMKLYIVSTYDAYSLFHPAINQDKIEPTPQLFNYIQCLLSDIPKATCRKSPASNHATYDESFQLELLDFLQRHLPRPPSLNDDMPDEIELETPQDFRHPFTDAFERTQRFWLPEMRKKMDVPNVIFKNFTHDKICTTDTIYPWSIHDEFSREGRNYKISPRWPRAYRLLVWVGAFICYCRPNQILPEIVAVEEYLHPHLKTIRKQLMRGAEQPD